MTMNKRNECDEENTYVMGFVVEQASVKHEIYFVFLEMFQY